MDAVSPDTKANIIATIIIGLIAVVGSIAGAIRGAEVGAKATREATKQSLDADRDTARENEERQQKAVRLLLSQEVAHNLASLRSLCEDVLAEPLPDGVEQIPDPEDRSFSIGERRARRLVRVAMPAWSRQAWNGLIALVPMALTRQEIERANRFYAYLETLTGIRDQLNEMAGEQPVTLAQPGLWGRGTEFYTRPPMTFDAYAPELWIEFERIANDILASGNPITVHEEGATEAAPG